MQKNPILSMLCKKQAALPKKADKLSVNLAEVVKDGTQLTIEKKRKGKAAQEEQSSTECHQQMKRVKSI